MPVNPQNQDLIDSLKNIIATYGNEVNYSIISTEMGSKYAKLVKKYGTLIDIGIYKLPDIDDIISVMSSEENVETNSIINEKITTFSNIGNLIPTIDEKYIPFGCFQTINRIVSDNHFLPTYIVGESGNGKSASIRQACAKANRELVYFNVTNETTEEDLIGSFILDNGNMIWKDGPVIIAMRRGAVLLLDEIDQLSNSAMSLQSILQNEPYYIKKTNEIVTPVKGFTIIGTANTKGNGSGGDRFIGANVLNEAFLERFNIVFEQPYPPLNIEMQILQHYSSDNKFCAKLVRWANIIRTGYFEGTISRCITTRRLIQIVNNCAILRDQAKGIEYALNRFEPEIKESMILAYEAMNNEPYDDGLDEIAGTKKVETSFSQDTLDKLKNLSTSSNINQTNSNTEFIDSMTSKYASSPQERNDINNYLKSKYI